MLKEFVQSILEVSAKEVKLHGKISNLIDRAETEEQINILALKILNSGINSYVLLQMLKDKLVMSARRMHHSAFKDSATPAHKVDRIRSDYFFDKILNIPPKGQLDLSI